MRNFSTVNSNAYTFFDGDTHQLGRVSFVRKESFFLCLLGFFILFTPGAAYSQISIDSLGTDTSQNELYECVRFTNASQNTVSVTNENNQEISLSVAQAKKRVRKSLRRAKTRQKRLKNRLKKLQRKLKDVKTKIIPRPNAVKKIKRLRRQIKKTRKALNTVKGQRRNLGNLRKEVSKCNKDAPLVGGLVLKTITYPSILFDGAFTSYHIGLFFNVTRPVERGEAFCLGSSQYFKGATQAVIIVDPCPVFDSTNKKCIAQHSGVRGFGITGVSGTDDPRACAPGDEPFRCDFGKANQKAAELLAQYQDVRILGRPDSSGCDRFRQ